MKATLSLVILTCGLSSYAQVISWSGAADGSAWSKPGNWVGGVVPGAANDVVITSGAGTTVAITSGNISVRSLQCSKGLNISGGSLTVTAGASSVSGALAISGGASLKAAGSTASLVANGLTSLVDAGLSATGGGSLRLPNLKNGTNNTQSTLWQADGAGSLLEVSSVTNLGASYYQRLNVRVYNGGSVDLHRVTSTTGSLLVYAEDNGSVVDLSGLSGRWVSKGNNPLNLEVKAGGSILVPNVTQLEYTTVRINDTGIIPTAQLNLLTNVDLTVDGASPNFGRVTNIDQTSLTALNGGAARLTNVTQVAFATESGTWKADGVGSLVDVSMLGNLAVNYYQRLNLQAYNGGSVDVHRLSNPTCSIKVDAQDPDSIVDLSGLSGRWSSQGNNPLQLEAQGGAAILIPNVTQLNYASLRIDAYGIVPTAQLNLLTNVDLTIDGAVPNFGSVTNIDDSSVTALNAGIARLTNVSRVAFQTQSVTWKADGTGSLVDLSRVNSLSGNYYQRLNIQAYNGGLVDAHGLGHPTCSIRIDAQDAGSVVNLSGLTGHWSSTANNSLNLEAQGSASILIPNVTELENAALRIDNTGSIPTAQLSWLTNVDLTVDAAAPNFGRVTNIDDTSVTALNGGVARLTNVTRVVFGTQSITWKADGTGSRVDVSAMSDLSGNYYQRLVLEAYNGGTLDVHRLSQPTCAIKVDAQDPGTVVDLSGISGRWASHANNNLQLEAQGGASILIPNVTQLENAALRIDDSGLVTTAQLNLLTNVDLTVDASAPNFGRVTNIDDTSVTALNGGVARLTNVARAWFGANGGTWDAEGSGSLVDLSNLTRIGVSYYQRLTVSSYEGGKVDLSKLESLSTGAVQILADGSGSEVDLSGLSSFISVGNGDSSLTARNGGEVLLGGQAFLLANVNLNLPSGNPVLPPTVIASSTLALYGTPWHSYWVERRDTQIADSPWIFMARVPLTTAVQPVAPTPPPNTEFRIWDFTADPPMLDLVRVGAHQVQMVLYGIPGQNYETLAGLSIAPGTSWQPVNSIGMTNAFRIFAPVSAPDPQHFFRAQKL